MILMKLFLSFLVIGAVSFGGGYGMISIVRDTVLNNGWLTEAQFINFIAVAESTPGPLAVNMATFVGSTQDGVLGALVATLGVVLPAFLIILLISIVLKNLIKHPVVGAILDCVRPCTIALILATTLILALETLMPAYKPDLRALAVLLLLLLTHWFCQRFFHHSPNPILMIIFSAALGIIFWGLIR
jgi:chromate transporter